MKLQYNEISPITGNLCVLVEDDPVSGDIVKICMESGYQTYLNSWKSSNEDIITNLELQFPYEVVSSKIIDENQNFWYKTFLISPHVLLYPDQDSWRVANLINDDPGSGLAVEVPISPGVSATKFLDEENSSVFGSTGFSDALYEFQHRITKIRNNHED